MLSLSGDPAEFLGFGDHRFGAHELPMLTGYRSVEAASSAAFIMDSIVVMLVDCSSYRPGR